jgi:hypothetical protein
MTAPRSDSTRPQDPTATGSGLLPSGPADPSGASDRPAADAPATLDPPRHATPEPARHATPEPPRPATFLQTAGTVFWSFFGVRKRRHFESDTRLNPVHVIVMGLIGAAVFVGTLLAIVSLILRAR